MAELPAAEDLPAPLVTREQWVGWKPQERDGKQTKVPVDPATGRYASATDPSTWTDFATTREHATTKAIGIGFVFTTEDPIVGVDLDDCRDPEDDTIADWARDIIDRLDSFTEVSPSGTGVHVLVEGDLPDGRNRHGDIELYDDARFFTVTGDRLSETPATIEPRQEVLAAVHAEYVAPDDPDTVDSSDPEPVAAGAASDVASGTEVESQGPGNDLDDTELLSRARSASNGAKFERLFEGDTSGYPSQSEADMALCSLLAFWTGGDAEQMDRLFRESELKRPKWDEQHFADGATYGERTLERAIVGTDEFYTGSSGSERRRESASNRSAEVSERGDGSSGRRSSDPATVPVDVIEELEAELQQLQSEKEALQAELEAERERRQELEVESASSETDGTSWLSRVLPWT
jgi:primase-polymerase (primpol)-like protein